MGWEKSGREASDPTPAPSKAQSESPELLRYPPLLMPHLEWPVCPPHPPRNTLGQEFPGTAALLSLLSGICGFLTFGAAVDPDVLLSYPSEDMAVAVARAFIILSVLTSYPILHFCGR